MDKKFWLVKFYKKYTTIQYIPKYKKGKIIGYDEKIELKEKEIHRYIVDSEEKADFLVEVFTNITTSAKKIELEG